MNYDLIIIKLDNPRMKQVIAHRIASNPSISLQKALSDLDNLPAVYKKDLSLKELEQATMQLQKLGAVCRALESKNPLDREIPQKKREPQEKKVPKKKKIIHSTISRAKPEKPLENVGVKKASVESMPRKKNARKKRSVATNVIILVVIGSVIGFLFLIGRGNKVQVKSTGPFAAVQSSSRPVKGKRGSSKGEIFIEESKEEGLADFKDDLSRAQVKKNSNAYADSAVFRCKNYECEIKFFKIALSFNKYNLRAWQGLVAAYRAAGRNSDAVEAEKQMRELFGEKTFTIEEIVKPYGNLSHYSRDNNGVCRIEYHSLSKKRAELERETYFLIRALSTRQKCKVISLYASTGKGTGMLVRIKPKLFPLRISGYLKKASISFIE